MHYVALGAGQADVSQTRSSSLRSRVKDVGSSALLVTWWIRSEGDPGGPPSPERVIYPHPVRGRGSRSAAL